MTRLLVSPLGSMTRISIALVPSIQSLMWQPTDRFLFFTRIVLGVNDLYITYRKEDNTWTNPKNLGPKINSAMYDLCPNITPDGKYLMFSRDNGRDSRDIYWVSTSFVDRLKHTNFIPYLKSNIPNQRATVGTFFEYQIPDSTFCDDDGNHTLSYTITINSDDQSTHFTPEWCSFDSLTRTISGIPTAEATKYMITVTATDTAGASAQAKFQLLIDNPTEVEDNGDPLPNKFKLNQNYPNPFNPATTIHYQLPESGFTKLSIYNLAGQEIETLVNTHQQAGEHEISWQAGGFASGTYLCRLQMDLAEPSPDLDSGRKERCVLETMKIVLKK